ncbi:MAG: Binding-protein-dependent transport system inner rane component [Acidimicrobiales bacterium]|jgi:NitT/TauT family transport system permease protein|nr:Binding-protein-dependent transport system inner rane component [Acidimicrobiales bacterium]
MPTIPRPEDDLRQLDAELAGIDHLDVPVTPAPSGLARVWAQLWPKLTAIALFFVIWQVVVWTHWRPEYILPGPRKTFSALGDAIRAGTLPRAVGVTMRRAALGYALAVVIGSVLGLAVARNRILRSAIASMITGLQTMPSIAWFPLAIVLFGLTEGAMMFVVILGAAPAIANGVISGVDHIPPLLLRAGRVLGARGLAAYRHVILPAALPGFVAGLKQGWAFAWRSLMAGELIVIIAKRPSLGQQLEFTRGNQDYPGLVATMLVILVIGIVIDSVLFGRIERVIRGRWGLVDGA